MVRTVDSLQQLELGLVSHVKNSYIDKHHIKYIVNSNLLSSTCHSEMLTEQSSIQR